MQILGVRGYYRNTMGERGKNDRRLYDDAIFIVTPERVYSFNANTDPGAFYKGIASLKAGEYLYKIGIHGLSKPKAFQYRALIQAGPVTVARDGVGDDTGFFGINIHRGGILRVSSIGCQTIPPHQWSAFIDTVKNEMIARDMKTIHYVLTENTDGPDAF
jgi:lysozyme